MQGVMSMEFYIQVVLTLNFFTVLLDYKVTVLTRAQVKISKVWHQNPHFIVTMQLYHTGIGMLYSVTCEEAVNVI